MNDRLSHLEHDINLLKRIELAIINAIRFDGKASRELSISPDVEELRRDVGEKE